MLFDCTFVIHPDDADYEEMERIFVRVKALWGTFLSLRQATLPVSWTNSSSDNEMQLY